MLGIENFPLFLGASVVLVVTPGSDTLYILSRSVAQGRVAGWLSSYGVCAGLCVHSIAAALGLSAILATSVLAFTLVKWVGAIYLVYLGIKILLDRSSGLSFDADHQQPMSGWQLFRQGVLVDVLNPKVALFFLAFLPQFINAAKGAHAFQFMVLGAIIVLIDLVWLFFLVLFASKVTNTLRGNRRFTTWLNRVMGTIFVGLGLKLASEKT